MTKRLAKLIRTLQVSCGCLAMAWPTLSRAETVTFDTVPTVTRYSDPACLFDSGKVKTSLVNGREILADRKGCLSVQGSDGVVYYVNRPMAKADCPKRMARGLVASVNAGSAGATGCKD